MTNILQTAEGAAAYARVSQAQDEFFGTLEVHYAYDIEENALAFLFRQTHNEGVLNDLLFIQTSRDNYMRRVQDKA